MYVRLAFAVAAHLESEILIVDEVLAVGDAEFQKKCLGKMGDVSKGEGRTVLFVSHNMAAVKRLCNKSIYFRNGCIGTIGKVSNTVNNYLADNVLCSEIEFESEIVKKITINVEEDGLYIKCKYSTWPKKFEVPHLGFIVSDIYENPVFGSNPTISANGINFIKQFDGEIIAKISSPKLVVGKYFLSIWFGDGIQDYFVRKSILFFEISKSNVGNNDDLLEGSGPVVPQVEWIQKK
jgi:lipopolysaccharide transport system ATP-binding protein